MLACFVFLTVYFLARRKLKRLHFTNFEIYMMTTGSFVIFVLLFLANITWMLLERRMALIYLVHMSQKDLILKTKW